jgi:hypothetical protein
VPKTVTQPRRKRLGVSINAQARPIERSSILGQEIGFRRQLEQNRSTGGDRKAGITALKRVANPVRFIFVEDDDLVGFGHGLHPTHMVHVDPAVREYEVRGGNAFLVACRRLDMRRPRRTQFQSPEAGGHRNRPWGKASSARDKQFYHVIELAFNGTLRKLNWVDRNDPLCEMIARKIIEIGSAETTNAVAIPLFHYCADARPIPR